MRFPTPDDGPANATYWRKRAEEAETRGDMAEQFTVMGIDDDGEWTVDQQWYDRDGAEAWASLHGGRLARRFVTQWETVQ